MLLWKYENGLNGSLIGCKVFPAICAHLVLASRYMGPPFFIEKLEIAIAFCQPKCKADLSHCRKTIHWSDLICITFWLMNYRTNIETGPAGSLRFVEFLQRAVIGLSWETAWSMPLVKLQGILQYKKHRHITYEFSQSHNKIDKQDQASSKLSARLLSKNYVAPLSRVRGFVLTVALPPLLRLVSLPQFSGFQTDVPRSKRPGAAWLEGTRRYETVRVG